MALSQGVVQNGDHLNMASMQPCFTLNIYKTGFYGRLHANLQTLFFFFSETLTSLRLWVNHVKDVKKLGGHQILCEDKMSKRSPKI